MFTLHTCKHAAAHEMIACTFYQTERACAATSLPPRSILSSDTKFQQMRDYFNDTRCRMLTQLVARDITGLELIRAFEQAPNLIETTYMTHSNRDHDDFIDQLVNVSHRSVTKSPHRCEPIPHTPPFVHPKPNPPLQRSPSPSPTAVKEHLPRRVSIPSSSQLKTNSNPPPSPRDTISSWSIPFSTPQPSPSVTPPPSLPRQSSDEQPFSMGYQWKGEDN